MTTLKEIPPGMYEANRYDTDDERVLTIHKDGKTYDIREDKMPENGWSEHNNGEGDEWCGHKSDCAVHNGPAMKPGPCDCGHDGE